MGVHSLGRRGGLVFDWLNDKLGGWELVPCGLVFSCANQCGVGSYLLGLVAESGAGEGSLLAECASVVVVVVCGATRVQGCHCFCVFCRFL